MVRFRLPKVCESTNRRRHAHEHSLARPCVPHNEPHTRQPYCHDTGRIRQLVKALAAQQNIIKCQGKSEICPFGLSKETKFPLGLYYPSCWAQKLTGLSVCELVSSCLLRTLPRLDCQQSRCNLQRKLVRISGYTSGILVSCRCCRCQTHFSSTHRNPCYVFVARQIGSLDAELILL